jgi:hypothetical protein
LVTSPGCVLGLRAQSPRRVVGDAGACRGLAGSESVSGGALKQRDERLGEPLEPLLNDKAHDPLSPFLAQWGRETLLAEKCMFINRR